MNQIIALKDQPKIFTALREGFKILSTHFYLMLFPIGLDLFFLFAPRLTIRSIATQTLSQFNSLAQAAGQSNDTVIQTLDTVKAYFQYFSLTAALRTYPVGVPSLLASRPIAANPLGSLQVIDLSNTGQVFLFLLLFSLIGLILGTFFTLATSRATVTVTRKVSAKESLRVFGNLLVLSLIIFVFALIISIPVMMIYGVFSALSPIIGIIIYFVAAMFLLTLIIPLYFAPHAVVLFDRTPIQAITMSLKTVRPYYSSTSFFLTLELLVAFLTNMLWQTPGDTSAMLFVGIFGHALITTALLIASFSYFLNLITLYQEKFVNPQPA